MASGTIYGKTSNEFIDAKVEWSSTTNISTNQSTVTAALYYKRNNTGYQTTGTGSFSITINGEKFSATKSLTITENAWVKAVEGTVTVSHNANGAKSIEISAAGSITSTSLTYTSVAGTATLDTIPRASTIDYLSCATKYFNGTMTYKYTPKSASFYNRCVIALNISGTYTQVKIINLGRQAASQQTATVTLSESELSIIYNKFPSSTQGTLRFTFRTYSDSGYSSQVGDAGYKEITLNIPNNSSTQPTATMTVSPVSNLSSPFNTLYIKGRTKVDVDFTNAEGKYGASIVSYAVSVCGKNYGSPFTSEYITTEGSVEVKGTIKDSRGFIREYTKTVTYIPYTNPRIIPASGDSEIICARCDASGKLNDSGTYLKIKAKRSYSKVESNGAQKNFCYIRYRYKAEGGSYSSWTTILATDASSDEVSTGALLKGTLETTKSYVVQVGVVDNLGEADATTVNIPTDKVYMHRAGSMNSFALGKYAEDDNTFDVAQDITAIFRGDVMFRGEAWLPRALGTNVFESTVYSGRRGGTGVYYRVCAGGKHVYVAFNVSFTTSSKTVRVESETIPNKPDYDVYALCPVGFSDGSRGIATASVSPNGRVNIYAVHKLPGATLSTDETVAWIDGYIDYWV